MRRILSGIVATVLAAGVGVAMATPAQADYCQGSSYSGKCFAAENVVRSKTLVETVIMQNKSKVNVNANCEFTKTITKEISATASTGVSASVSVKASIFASVDAEVSASLSSTLKQSASSATKMGGNFTLKPGQSVTCNRYYYDYRATVREYNYTGTKTTTVRTYSTRVPSAFGVTFS